MNATKRFLAQMQRECAQLSSPVILLALDDDDAEDCVPKNIIVCVDHSTSLIPLTFRNRVVCVGERRVFVAHDDGVRHLATAISEAIVQVLCETKGKAK